MDSLEKKYLTEAELKAKFEQYLEDNPADGLFDNVNRMNTFTDDNIEAMRHMWAKGFSKWLFPDEAKEGSGMEAIFEKGTLHGVLKSPLITTPISFPSYKKAYMAERIKCVAGDYTFTIICDKKNNTVSAYVEWLNHSSYNSLMSNREKSLTRVHYHNLCWWLNAEKYRMHGDDERRYKIKLDELAQARECTIHR